MTEGVAKVQKRTISLLGLISRYNLCFHLNRATHNMNTRSNITGCHFRAIGFKPFKEFCIPKQTVFDDLTAARQKIARGQCSKDINVSQHKAWLVKRSDKVLTVTGVDTCLATHRTVDLRQKRCWDLNKPYTATQDCCRESNQITDDTTTKGYNHITAFNLLVQQPFNAGA